MQLISISYNHDTGRKFINLIVVLKKFELGLARAGKFQLELISTI